MVNTERKESKVRQMSLNQEATYLFIEILFKKESVSTGAWGRGRGREESDTPLSREPDSGPQDPRTPTRITT